MKKVLTKPKKERTNSYNTSLHLFGNKEISITYSGNCVPMCGCSDKEKSSRPNS